MNKPVSDRVRDGIALLGDRVSEIDIERLDIHSMTDCPLGQLFGNFGEGRREMCLGSDIGPAEYGFDPYPYEMETNSNIWEDLRQEWKRQLRQLLTPA